MAVLRNSLFLLMSVLFLNGCATYASINNRHKSEKVSEIDYSLKKSVQARRSDDVTLVLAFSGGGTRAAALAYGVLQALRDAEIDSFENRERLIDKVDLISSVSGGSFTAAYYGLYGEKIFTDFEPAFLRKDVESALFSGFLSPTRWFSERGRTEMAIEHYEDSIFKGATFEDLFRESGPLVVINASDLGRGVRFSFLQEYFDLVCSDINSYPVAYAVTASSAVPLLFDPVVLKNFSDCENSQLIGQQERGQLTSSPQMLQVIDGLASYKDKEKRQYIHLVDGGITDNLGLLAIYEMVEVVGGANRFMQKLGAEVAPRLVVISVNASTKPDYQMDSSNKAPSVEETINAMSDVQLHRSNATTLELFEKSMHRWSEQLSTPQQHVKPYFISIDFRQIKDKQRRRLINQIPTSLTLQAEQVDTLIAAGRNLLNAHPVFLKLLQDLNKKALLTR